MDRSEQIRRNMKLYRKRLKKGKVIPRIVRSAYARDPDGVLSHASKVLERSGGST